MPHGGRPVAVELAQLTYQRTRLVRSWTHLERQRGGAGFMGGPGERQIEIDRRLIDDRIVRLKKELADVQRTRGLHRSSRKMVPYPWWRWSATPTPASHPVQPPDPGRRDGGGHAVRHARPDHARGEAAGRAHVILSDTVGFISDLPTQLVAAFRATLEEVTEADLLLHVRDAADPESAAQKHDVEQVLDELGLTATTPSR